MDNLNIIQVGGIFPPRNIDGKQLPDAGSGVSQFFGHQLGQWRVKKFIARHDNPSAFA